MSDQGRPYHHGNLRRALLDSALELINERGPARLSLREVARRAGVSHAAPIHHFKDKTGLLTAIAAQGWSMLAAALTDTAARSSELAELGVSYVVFATTHPAHFAVMRSPGLVLADDQDLTTARDQARVPLLRGAAQQAGTPAEPGMVLAAWSLVHGLAVLLQEGLVVPEPGQDAASLARAITGRLR
ncbi:MAG: TetR/AcrR family transcriptional regulator [Pseudonocardiaceae bacterium]